MGKKKLMALFMALTMMISCMSGMILVNAGPVTSEPYESKTTWADAAYLFEQQYTGIVEIEFDVELFGDITNGVIGFNNASANVGDWNQVQFILRFNGGKVDAYNGGGYAPVVAGLSYVAGDKFHIKETINVATKTYSIVLTDEDGVEWTVAENFGQRTGTGDVANIGQMTLIGVAGDEPVNREYEITNLKVNGAAPAVNFKRNIHTEPITMYVGADKEYKTPAAAMLDAIPGDTIMIDPGTYTNSDAVMTINVPDVTIIGVSDADGNKPLMKITPGFVVPSRQGTWVIAATDITVENIAFTGADNPNATATDNRNYSGIRINTVANTVLKDCLFYENNNGILTSSKSTTPAGRTADLYIIGCEFRTNAYRGGGHTHNMYIGNIDEVWVIDTLSHKVEGLGHLLKTRADNTYVINSILMDGTLENATFQNAVGVEQNSGSNSLIDQPNGGNLVVIGSVLQESATPGGNSRLVSYGVEGFTNVGETVLFMNNTIVNMRSTSTASIEILSSNPDVNMDREANTVFYNNVYTVAGTAPAVSYKGVNETAQRFTTENGNLVVDKSAYVNYDKYDFRVAEGAALIGAGVDIYNEGIIQALIGIIEGVAGKNPFQYQPSIRSPLAPIARASVGGVGANEFYAIDFEAEEAEDEANKPPVPPVVVNGFKPSSVAGEYLWPFDAPMSGTFDVTFKIRYNFAPSGDHLMGLYNDEIGNASNTGGSQSRLVPRIKKSSERMQYAHNGAWTQNSATYGYVKENEVYSIKMTVDLEDKTYSAWAQDAAGTEYIICENAIISHTGFTSAKGMLFFTPVGTEGSYEVFSLQAGSTLAMPDAVLTIADNYGEIEEPAGPFLSSNDFDANKIAFDEPMSGRFEVEFDMKLGAVPDGESVYIFPFEDGDVTATQLTYAGYSVRIPNNGAPIWRVNGGGTEGDKSVRFPAGNTFKVKYVFDLDAGTYSLSRALGNGSMQTVFVDADPGTGKIDVADGMVFFSTTNGTMEIANLVVTQLEPIVEPNEVFKSKSDYGTNKIFFDTQLEGNFTVEFDMLRTDDASGDDAGITLFVNGGGTANAVASSAYRWRFSGTRLQYYSLGNGPTQSSVGHIPVGTPVHVKIEFDMNAGTYSTWIDDVAFFENAPKRENYPDPLSAADGMIFYSAVEGSMEITNFTATQNEIVIPPVIEPTTLTVGPSGMYATLAAALVDAKSGDTIEIDANGTYHNADAMANIRIPNLTIVGVNGVAHMQIDRDFDALDRMGIWVVRETAPNLTVKNIEFSGAHDFREYGDLNHSGVRALGTIGLVFENCYFHDNDNGLLSSGNASPDSSITFINCEFWANGYGDGQSHNMYIGNIETFKFIDSYSHDPYYGGHLLKSRARNTYIINSVLGEFNASPEYVSNANIDIPEGGNLYVVGSLLHQAADENGNGYCNYTMITYGLEGFAHGAGDFVFVNNTVVDDMFNPSETPWASMIAFGNKVVLADLNAIIKNNIYTGNAPIVKHLVPNPETPGFNFTNVTADFFKAEDGNFAGNPAYLNKAGYDYRLTGSSAAVLNKGVAVAPIETSIGTLNLVPTKQPSVPFSVTPVSRAILGGKIDIGAFEFNDGDIGAQTEFILSTEATQVRKGDYFEVNASFAEVTEANVINISFNYNTNLFDFAGYTLADGMTVLDAKMTSEGFAMSLMVPEYGVTDLLSFGLIAKEDGNLQNGDQQISATVECVVKLSDTVGENGFVPKAIVYFDAALNVPTFGGIIGDTNNDGVLDLIDLSNIIDAFGIDTTDAKWNTVYKYLDFNGNGSIDIADVSHVAWLVVVL